MNLMGRFSISLILLLSLVSLTQLWFQLFSWEIFFKIVTSLFGILVAVVVVLLIIREYKDEKRMRDDGYID
ncbi:MAG: hypothetical protein FNT15_04380 [Sulfurovum sp.]|nr:MAG: hypothetical protein FNT15_04380 [Sulfurovum sp.]